MLSAGKEELNEGEGEGDRCNGGRGAGEFGGVRNPSLCCQILGPGPNESNGSGKQGPCDRTPS